MKRLEGKVAVVTGGGRGIGRAAAFPADVTDEGAVGRLVDGALVAFGRCDILVNAAGVAGPVGEVAGLGLAEWEAGILGNLRPAFLCCRAVIPHMRRQGSGRILNVASGLAVHPLPGVSAYGASKAAIVQFSRVLALEEKPHGLHVFAVHPGVVRTAVLEALFESSDSRAPTRIRGRIDRLEAAGHLLTPEQSARLLVYLATSAADDLAGQFVRIDDPAIQSRLTSFFAD